jgi:hypothetical protein
LAPGRSGRVISLKYHKTANQAQANAFIIPDFFKYAIVSAGY